jgi:cytochrome c oxidase subunit 2
MFIKVKRNFLSSSDAPISPFLKTSENVFEEINRVVTSFQDPASPLMEGLIGLHSDVWSIMLFVAGFVSYMMLSILSKAPNESFKVHHDRVIEVVWTSIPALMLCVIAVPSFSLLYSLDEMVEPSLTIKTTGYQWYWNYQYNDYEIINNATRGFDHIDGVNFDSNLLQEEDLEIGQLRLLEVDNRLVLPVNKHIRLLTSAGDVIHSFAVPSLGIKLDAIPGRLNQTMLLIKRQGTYYGQCSELCGASHSMMPITIEAVEDEDYVDWINARLEG